MMRWMAMVLGLMLGFVVVYFGYIGLTTPVWEGDSLAYHLPIAQAMVTGEFWMARGFDIGGMYYPAAAELILAVMMWLNIPLNLYNLAGWLGLLVMVGKLGKRVGLGKELAMLTAAGVVMWNSILRLISTQTIDIWLAVWWVAAVYLLESPKKNSKYFVTLGIVLGFLIGTKFSGVGFAAGLAIFYGRNILKMLNFQRGLALGLGVIVLGLSWYARNYLWTGNPVYPGWFMGLPGMVGFEKFLNWNTWKTITGLPGGAGLFIQAVFSEYLGWGLLVLLPIFLRSKWMWLGLFNLAIYLVLPSGPANIISDIRYAYPAFIALAVGGAIEAKRRKREEWWGIWTVVNGVVVLTQLNYMPKLFMGYILGVGVWAWRKRTF